MLSAGLWEYRKRNRLKQSALAEHLGVNQSTLSRWERGQFEPNLRQRALIKDLLHAPTQDDRALVATVKHAPGITLLLCGENAALVAASEGAQRVLKPGLAGSMPLAERLPDVFRKIWRDVARREIVALDRWGVRRDWSKTEADFARAFVSYQRVGDAIYHVVNLTLLSEAEWQALGGVDGHKIITLDDP